MSDERLFLLRNLASVEEVTAERDAFEAERDALALRLAMIEAGDNPERVPAEVVERLLAGEQPTRVWREHRGLSLRRLADAAGISSPMLSEIETGKKDGSIRTLARVARALGVDVDDLLPWDDEPPVGGGVAGSGSFGAGAPEDATGATEIIITGKIMEIDAEEAGKPAEPARKPR